MKLRLGIYSIDLTNHKNYKDVFRNITSPFFGQFVGSNIDSTVLCWRFSCERINFSNERVYASTRMRVRLSPKV